MTRMNNASSSHDASDSMAQNTGRMAHTARLLPKVTFGLSVAVLTGVAIIPVTTSPAAAASQTSATTMTTTTLAAAINDATGSVALHTTCCGQSS